MDVSNAVAFAESITISNAFLHTTFQIYNSDTKKWQDEIYILLVAIDNNRTPKDTCWLVIDSNPDVAFRHGEALDDYLSTVTKSYAPTPTRFVSHPRTVDPVVSLDHVLEQFLSSTTWDDILDVRNSYKRREDHDKV